MKALGDIRVAVFFDRIGPYHVARLRAAAAHVDLVAIEIAASSDDYAWDVVEAGNEFERVTLFKDHSRTVAPSDLWHAVGAALEQIAPDGVVAHGWAEPAALAALNWAAKRRVPSVVLSESQEKDEVRSPLREFVKRRVLAGVGAALVGGTPHVAYAKRLGVQGDHIFTGYDVVDNDHFAAGADDARKDAEGVRMRLGLPDQYFVASSRFIVKKNIPGLLDSYARYRLLAGEEAWALVLLGDGPERATVERQIDALNLGGTVHLPGFIQYEAIPAYFGLASAFVHASTTEQWGLVVNEAMASSLPVLVSERCGCVPDLVHDGVNGFRLDSLDPDSVAALMHRIAHGDVDRVAMGEASRRIVGDWGPDRFAKGLACAVEAAIKSPRRHATLPDLALMRVLAYR